MEIYNRLNSIKKDGREIIRTRLIPTLMARSEIATIIVQAVNLCLLAWIKCLYYSILILIKGKQVFIGHPFLLYFL